MRAAVSALALALCLVVHVRDEVPARPAAPDAPTSVDAPTTAPEPALANDPAPALVSAPAPSRVGLATSFPRPSLERFFLDSGRSVLGLFPTEPKKLVFLGGMALGAALAVAYDVPLHAAISAVPNPNVFGMREGTLISFLGEGYVDVIGLLAIGLIGGRAGQRVAWAGSEALLAVALVSRLGKLVFRLERPSADPSRHHWFSEASADAMPSGHTMTAFATASVLASEWPKLAPLFYLVATVVGFARVQEHTHWPGDVVVGAALGTLIGLKAHELTRRYELEVQPWAAPGGAGVALAHPF